eukprot:363215-Chlamydomonas_euryale.AAC.7
MMLVVLQSVDGGQAQPQRRRHQRPALKAQLQCRQQQRRVQLKAGAAEAAAVEAAQGCAIRCLFALLPLLVLSLCWHCRIQQQEVATSMPAAQRPDVTAALLSLLITNDNTRTFILVRCGCEKRAHREEQIATC